MERVALPLPVPLQLVLAVELVLMVIGGLLFETVTDSVSVQPLAPVTVRSYVPARTPDKFCVVAPLDHE